MTDYGTTDRLTGGTASASSIYNATYSADKACDDNNTTRWATVGAPGFPSWWKYDFGAGVSWKIAKVSIKPYKVSTTGLLRAFTVNGSNNDSSYTELYSGEHENTDSLETYTFENTTAYRYIKLIFTSNYYGNSDISIYEIAMYEALYFIPKIIIF